MLILVIVGLVETVPVLLYLAISLAVQMVIITARAQRLNPALIGPIRPVPPRMRARRIPPKLPHGCPLLPS